MNTDPIRQFTLEARELLTRETEELLLQVYGLKTDGSFLAANQIPAFSRLVEAKESRRRIELLFADEEDAGYTKKEAYGRLVKEVAFTHLNRLVALKMLENRKLIQGTLDRHHESNAFKKYLGSGEHDEDFKLYEAGVSPIDDLNEGPRDKAYRHFLLWQYRRLASEIRVLFDPENLPSRLFPRPKILRELIDRLNHEDLNEAWAAGNEETIGWVYQFFIEEEKDAAFARVFKDKKKFQKEDIAAATQVFTPRWIVKFLVQNSLGRLWVSMHPDSKLAETMDYLVPLNQNERSKSFRRVNDIKILDPATGTMHFGLVAFDLLAEMYREEIFNAGKPGWPEQPSVNDEHDIPAAIVAQNIFGIDIDLRAIQLAALTLFIRSKSFNTAARIQDSNLACADVSIFRGKHLEEALSRIDLPQAISTKLMQDFCRSLDDAGLMGSLVRIETHFQSIAGPELRRFVDAYVKETEIKDEKEAFFHGETSKGLRLLNLMLQRYDIVFTNPPYMSSRNMSAEMVTFLKNKYPSTKGDLYAAFIQRCGELVGEGGRLAMVTQQSFMFIRSYENFRFWLLERLAIETMAHHGPRAFPEVQGEKVNTTAFVLRQESFPNDRENAVGIYFRLVKQPDAVAKQFTFEKALARRKGGETDPHIYVYRQAEFSAIEGSPWVYWVSPGIRSVFREHPKFLTLCRPIHGTATYDNFRFLRYWWEVAQYVDRNCDNWATYQKRQGRYVPYMKGGDFKRWYGNQEFVLQMIAGGRALLEFLDSKRDTLRGLEFIFKRGVTWPNITVGRFSARLSPGGFIFDMSGSSAFPDDIPLVLALLNSSFANYALRLINPTVNFQVGDIARLPVPKQSSNKLRQLVETAIAFAKAHSEEDETTYDFIAPPDWINGIQRVEEQHCSLEAVEKEIDEEVYGLYEISDVDRKTIEAELADPIARESDEENEEQDEDEDEIEVLSKEELAARWISYAVGIALGRFKPGIEGELGRGNFTDNKAAGLRELSDTDGIMVLEEGHPDDLAARVIQILTYIYDDHKAASIIQTATGRTGALRADLEKYLLGDFFKDHVKGYRKRPIYWLLQSPEKNYNVYAFYEKMTADTLSLLRGKRYLGGRIHRGVSDLKHAQEMERNTFGKEKAQWLKRALGLAELLEDLNEFEKKLTEATNTQIDGVDGKKEIVGWKPEFDDGVLLNAAPIYYLMPSWTSDPKKAWKALEDEEYDWSYTAMRYWPEHVLEACKKNKSYAIAHGLA